MFRFLWAMLLSIALTGGVLAQTTNATLGGTAADASGALIPGVTVTATNLATGIVSTALTNEAGAYQFASLQTGTYKVQAELPGFQTQVVNNFALGIGQQARLNFTLQVGAVSQTVEVSVAADTELKTTSASVATLLPQTQLQDLPLGSRNIQTLLLTMAQLQLQAQTHRRLCVGEFKPSQLAGRLPKLSQRVRWPAREMAAFVYVHPYVDVVGVDA